MSTSVAAVLWDVDGTLIDSEPAWIHAQTALVNEFGGVWTHDDGLSLVGSTMEQTVDALQVKGVTLDNHELLTTLESRVLAALRRGISWRPGVLELVGLIGAAGIPQAIVTTSRRILVEPVLEALQGLGVAMAVTGDDIVHGKPDPEPYLRAAHLLNVDIIRCIAIEDSPTGLRSALASGATTVGVPHDIPLAGIKDIVLWPSLEGRSLEELQHLQTARGLT